MFKQIFQNRLYSTSSNICRPNNEIVGLFVNNRNPRNLERLRIGRKPMGYFVDKPGKLFWHKLMIKTSSRHVLAYIQHFENGTVIEASSNEWAIRKHLYSATDTSAYINLGRVLADRCLMMGISEVYCLLNRENSTKLKLFMNELEKGGVSLQEPPVFKTPEPLDDYREEKPWEVVEQ